MSSLTSTSTSADVVESHGLRHDDPTARELVERWREATLALRRYMPTAERDALDLVDVSTLADLYVHAHSVAA